MSVRFQNEDIYVCGKRRERERKERDAHREREREKRTTNTVYCAQTKRIQ